MLLDGKNADVRHDVDEIAVPGPTQTFLVTVERRSGPATVVMPVVKDEFEVSAPTLLEACLTVLHGRYKAKANVALRRTHDPYTHQYLSPDFARFSGVAWIVADDVASVRRAVEKAGHSYERESLAAVRRLGAAFAVKDGDNSISAVQDERGEPAELVGRLRTFAETVWVDEEGKGHAYDQDMVDRLKALGLGSPEGLAVARDAYWARTTEVVADAFLEHGHQVSARGM